MIRDRMHIKVSRDACGFEATGIYIYTTSKNGTIRVATSMEMDVLKEDACKRYDPVVTIPAQDDECLQELMDNLWAIGIRPTAGHGSAGQAKAMEEHLRTAEKTMERQHEVTMALLQKEAA